jgi:hypothetical protein
MDLKDSLVMGTATDSIIDQITGTHAPAVQPVATAPADRNGHGILADWLEMYDYAGGARFRGFIAEGTAERSMFVFFDEGVLGNDLKPG